MFTEDDVLTEVLRFTLPVNRGQNSAHDFLADYYKQFLLALETATNKNDTRKMRPEFYTLINNNRM